MLSIVGANSREVEKYANLGFKLETSLERVYLKEIYTETVLWPQSQYRLRVSQTENAIPHRHTK